MNAAEYKEISNALISNTRKVVISECSKGGFTVAQQLMAEENGKKTNVFMKGAFHVADVSGLYNMRDAINMAIDKIENGQESEEDQEEEWDAEKVPEPF